MMQPPGPKPSRRGQRLRSALLRFVALSGPALLVLLPACAPEPPPVAESPTMPPTFSPLSPGTHEFDAPGGGRARNDYFTVAAPRRADADFRTGLLRLLRQQHQALASVPPLHSIYVYERTARLNPQFQGGADDLRGVHDKDLVAYARWTAGREDIVWLIHQGQVVHDLQADRPQEPPFEFD
jgi:hypothetical protein